jgi:O-methyltransferase involved in polyketide biosynthesis
LIGNDVPSFNDPQHWQDRAAEARNVAELLDDEPAKQLMLRIADAYDNLAKRAEKLPLSSAPSKTEP